MFQTKKVAMTVYTVTPSKSNFEDEIQLDTNNEYEVYEEETWMMKCMPSELEKEVTKKEEGDELKEIIVSTEKNINGNHMKMESNPAFGPHDRDFVLQCLFNKKNHRDWSITDEK